MATLTKSPAKTAMAKVRGRKAKQVDRRQVKNTGYQLLLFQPKEITETEKLIYLFWDAIKRKRAKQFNDAVRGLAQWLSPQQFDGVVKECKRHMAMDDKAWLLVALEGHRLSPLSLFLQSQGEKYLLLKGNKCVALIVVLFFIKWQYAKEVMQWESN
jgi:hypothetical protein